MKVLFVEREKEIKKNRFYAKKMMRVPKHAIKQFE